MTNNNTALAKQFRATTEELIRLIEQFDHESFNRKLSVDTWSAGEVAEHLLILDTRLNTILESTTHPTERDAKENLPAFSARLSNRVTKLDAPSFLIPSAGIKSQPGLVEKIREERIKIIQTIEAIDLNFHSKQFPHKLFGELTAHEWISFVDMHARRHMEQLTELLNTAN